MNKKTKGQQLKSGQTCPPLEDLNKKKQKAESRDEVAGRHKNDGQKDHKGAR